MRPFAVAALLFTTSALLAQPLDNEKPITGFTPANAARERTLEHRLDTSVARENLRVWMNRLAGHPHAVGSAYGKENAEFIASLFRSWGYDTAIERFDVLFPTPRTRVLELVAPETFAASLTEPPLASDPTSSQTSEQLPPYNAYSIDGDVMGDLVYVNYGLPADYEVLARNGVDVKGKIVIARYGNSWRGIKPKVAAEHGAIGCIIYSDPYDDGYYEGDVYPKGAFRNEHGAQRGSVADMPVRAGDPLTPNVGATPNAKRLDRKEVETLTKIPVLPISYADALPLLRNLGGPTAPESFRGALPITYHLGSGPARVHLKLEFDWNIVPAYDVIARMSGSDLADEWIVRGNHHDAWVNGASDPISGQVAMLESARIIGELAKSGWKPRRTLIFCAWDGEEPGLLGSTEWVEAHQAELRKHAVVYINTDSVSRGFLDVGGSHTLQTFVSEATRDVDDPQRGTSLLERLRAHEIVHAKSAEARAVARDRIGLELDALGSGSDFTPFLQHAGIASLDIGFKGDAEGGSYHSIYDSIEHFTKWRDPNFSYGLALVKLTGRMMLRLANADVLPMRITPFSAAVKKYLGEVSALADRMRAETEEQNREVREGTLVLASDATEQYVAPPLQDPVPHLELAPLQNAVSHLERSARELDRALVQVPLDAPSSSARAMSVDAALMHLEQALLREDGLPHRPWFHHQVYAPGLYTGYGVKTLPGVREAIEQRKWQEANEQIAIVARVLETYTAEVERTTELARGKSE